LDFASCVGRWQELDPYIPDFQSILFDLSRVPDIDLTSSLVYQAALKAFKYAARNLRPLLRAMLRSVSTAPVDDSFKTFLNGLFEYILNVGKDIDETAIEEELLHVSSDETREMYMTLAEKIKARGKQEGIREGKREGEIL
jgi:hypothetical protein